MNYQILIRNVCICCGVPAIPLSRVQHNRVRRKSRTEECSRIHFEKICVEFLFQKILNLIVMRTFTFIYLTNLRSVCYDELAEKPFDLHSHIMVAVLCSTRSSSEQKVDRSLLEVKLWSDWTNQISWVRRPNHSRLSLMLYSWSSAPSPCSARKNC